MRIGVPGVTARLAMIALAGGLVLAGCEKKKDADKPAGQETAAPQPAQAPQPSPEAALPEGSPPPSELARDTAAVARGEALAEANCTRCHATQTGQKSTHASAPSFATLFTNYPPDYIAEAFAEGVFVGHGDMPAFEFSPDQIDDLVAYLKTLGPPG
ncbi:c-type cytochrome [Sphingosinicella microcystinivorans]|uniref:c-type cytochrome n=1 Tax=Sphingosinicella microcystinivorans TaxID=335406 RepID=UPI0022F3D293|nr:cytochrome c [Sphingosinicella microcystinivorans]WBX82498.1 cytochrome c [Sphingosinicella microcystinivorans]